jgi:mannose-6-phosphate isomerase-like protein (cupin superfamily)
LLHRLTNLLQTSPREEVHEQVDHYSGARRNRNGHDGSMVADAGAGAPEQTLFHDAVGEGPDARGGAAIRHHAAGRRQPVPPPSREQWTAVQEGEVTFTVQGKPPQVLKAGDYNYVPRGTIHRQQNLSDKPARYIEMRIFDKDKPAAEQVN